MTGQTGEPFVRAESFTMWLSGPALLRGVLEASQVELDKPVLTLAVDDTGGGNWTNIELKSGDMPFVPRDVALRSVRLTEGAFHLQRGRGTRRPPRGHRWRASADGLKGPFRFKGSASWAGSAHDVKFATDFRPQTGRSRLRFPRGATFAERLHAGRARFRFEQQADIQRPLDGEACSAGQRNDHAAGEGCRRFSISNPSYRRSTWRKIREARAFARQRRRAANDHGIGGRDLDGIARGSIFRSIEMARHRLARGRRAGKRVLREAQATYRRTDAIRCGRQHCDGEDQSEQVKVGGENAGGCRSTPVRQGNVTHLKTFKVSLPGGSRLDLAGDLKNNAGKFSFAGNAFIGGSSFGRLKSWAEKSGVPIDFNADGSYSAAGKLEVDDTRFRADGRFGRVIGAGTRRRAQDHARETGNTRI